jgi:hypothetical protein
MEFILLAMVLGGYFTYRIYKRLEKKEEERRT